jgi:hypothetical protein
MVVVANGFLPKKAGNCQAVNAEKGKDSLSTLWSLRHRSFFMIGKYWTVVDLAFLVGTS